MPILTLLVSNWFDLLQSAAIVAGLFYTALGFSLNSRSHRADLIFEISKAYRAIWANLLEEPSLARILNPSPDLDSIPITAHEERFTLLLLMHLSSVHHAMELGLYPSWPGLERDIRSFFSLPIPSKLLERYLPLQTTEFRNYLNRVLAP